MSVKEPGWHTVTLNPIPLAASTDTSSTILLLPLSLVRPSSVLWRRQASRSSAHFFYFAAKINPKKHHGSTPSLLRFPRHHDIHDRKTPRSRLQVSKFASECCPSGQEEGTVAGSQRTSAVDVWPRPEPLGGQGKPTIPPPPWSPVIMYPSGELDSFAACVLPLGGGECDKTLRRSTGALDRYSGRLG